MRKHLGGIAALCVGACFVWSCQGDVGPIESGNSPGPAGANGAAGQPAGGGAGQPVTGAAGQSGKAGQPATGPGPTVSGGAGQPASGSAGQQPASGGAGQPASGAAGQPASGSAGQPASGAAGQPGSGTAGQTGGGAAGQGGGAGQPVSGAAGQPVSGGAGQPASGGAGQPASGGAGQPASGGAGQPASGGAGQPASGGAGQPASGSAGQPVVGGTGPAVGGAAGTTAPPSTTAGATIVPLYTSPGDASWSGIVAAKKAHPKVGVVAIVNPNNGPGSAVSSAYVSGIAGLTAAGIKVVGYVATGYGAKATAAVEADIDRWKSFYPGQLSGIFFDEQSNQASYVAHYHELSQYAKAQGLTFTIGNPGTDTAESYIGALDVMLIYETDGLPSASQMGGWHSKYAPSNFGVIPYAVAMDSTFVRNARQYVEYIYLQNDNLPNPWDSLPGYFADLLAALE